MNAETISLCGVDKSLTNQPVNLSWSSPNVLHLMVVDLPELIKIALEGQLADLADQIDRMAFPYIDSDNAILLAISANQHLANSESLLAPSRLYPRATGQAGFF
jgi:hypothetical protein